MRQPSAVTPTARYPTAPRPPRKASADSPTVARSDPSRPAIWASTAPRAAPLATPSTAGSARGFRVRAWKATPATASPPPARVGARGPPGAAQAALDPLGVAAEPRHQSLGLRRAAEEAPHPLDRLE